MKESDIRRLQTQCRVRDKVEKLTRLSRDVWRLRVRDLRSSPY